MRDETVVQDLKAKVRMCVIADNDGTILFAPLNVHSLRDGLGPWSMNLKKWIGSRRAYATRNKP